MGKRMAIVGATGAVGTTMLSILEGRDFPVSDLRLMASSRSAGRVIPTKWGDVTVEDLETADPAGIEVALFSAGGSRSREYAPKFAAAGCVVIDNSSAFRQEPDVPLVVAQVVIDGRNLMPPLGLTLSPEQIQDVAEFVARELPH